MSRLIHPAPDGPGAPALVVLPTYNEVENLPGVVSALRAAVDADLLVVDDASEDGTAELARRLAGENRGIGLLARTGKLGLGSAYAEAFRYALDRGYRHVVQMDCDYSHDPRDVPRLLAELLQGRADLVIGSRYAPGGAIDGWDLSRRVLSRGGNTYARLLLGRQIHDWTAGFKAFRSETLASLLEPGPLAEGYAFQVEMNWRALQQGWRVVEVPVTFVDRRFGESKLGAGIIGEAVRRVWELSRSRLRP